MLVSCSLTAERYKPSASVSASTTRPKEPSAVQTSSATADVTGSPTLRSGWRIFFLLCVKATRITLVLRTVVRMIYADGSASGRRIGSDVLLHLQRIA